MKKLLTIFLACLAFGYAFEGSAQIDIQIDHEWDDPHNTDIPFGVGGCTTTASFDILLSTKQIRIFSSQGKLPDSLAALQLQAVAILQKSKKGVKVAKVKRYPVRLSFAATTQDTLGDAYDAAKVATDIAMPDGAPEIGYSWKCVCGNSDAVNHC
jgi:hypothetical protein